MANKNLDRLLDDPEKGVNKTHGENGTLSRLFRLILKKRRIGPEKFGAMMADYLRDPRNRIVNNRKKVQSARGNLGMALSQSKMTWKVFCKGLRFNKVWKIDIAIRTYYQDGTTDIHETSMTLSGFTPSEDATGQNQSSATTNRDTQDEDVQDGTDE